MSDIHAKKTWSQLGEDALLSHMFKGLDTGFYVDVGAFHPEKYSNTCLLHRKGWTGLNIDVSAETVELLKRVRPNDTSVHAAVSNHNGTATAFMFDDGPSTINTLDKESADRWSKKTGQKYFEREIRVATLDSLLSEHAGSTQISFLNIDVEGLEMQVLAGTNIERYRPKVMAVEIHAKDVQAATESDVVKYLCRRGYRFVAYSLITAFFVLD